MISAYCLKSVMPHYQTFALLMSTNMTLSILSHVVDFSQFWPRSSEATYFLEYCNRRQCDVGIYLLNQPVPGAAIHLLQNLGTRQDVRVPAMQTLHYRLWVKVHALTSRLSSLRSLYVNMVGLWLTVSLAVFSGLTMFSIYKNCDPLTNGDIRTSDQVTAAAIYSSSLLTITWTSCCYLTKH